MLASPSSRKVGTIRTTPSPQRARRRFGAVLSAVLTGSLALAALALAADPPPTPTITGTLQVGQTVKAEGSSGTWEWFSCSSADTCTPVGTDSDEYTIDATDEGRQLKVKVTAEGESSESALTEPVAAAPPPPPPPNPPNITAVTIDGTPHVGNTLTAAGTNTGGPGTTTWQWCGATCHPVSTSSSYKVQPADGGHQLTVQMTVTNADGSDTGSDTVSVPEPPEITEAPEIFPDNLGVGDTARSTAGFAIHGTSTPKWQWRLCSSATGIATCQDIVGETTRSYVVAGPDAGSWLRVRMTVAGRGPDAVAHSDAKFISKPEDPPPPLPSEPFTSTGTTPETPTLQPTVSVPTLLNPFPVIRIRGRTTRVGAQLTLLSVRAPRGARINVRCKSRYCPRSRLAINARLRRLRVFERSLRAGVVLEIRVMHAKRIGKYTRFLIRRAAPPLRRDACLAPGSRRPTRCPGG